MHIALGIAFVVILVAMTAGATGRFEDKEGTPLPPSPPLPDFVRKVLDDPKASKDDLLKAAAEADKAGYPKLAEALRERASFTAQLIASPWPDVTSGAWTRFASAIAGTNKPTTINPRGFFGVFQLGVRRLSDLGVMTNPRTRTTIGPDGRTIKIWEGDWIIPQEKFLSDPALQYRYFGKSMDLYRSIIVEKFKQVLGLDIDGKIATLSGLLTLAHMSGSEGMHKWLTDGEIRKKFTWVTDAYHRANGIF